MTTSDDAAIAAEAAAGFAALKAELKVISDGLEALLTGDFTAACDDALDSVGGRVASAAELAQALTHLAEVAKAEAVDEAEAADMYLENLTRPEFYLLARNYFSTLQASLDLDGDDDGIVPEESV
eukprot:Rhum_TRINITY_DN14437_c5_g1::Rhum_TRINITY_DN14437_c5_g1_i2::g.89648::m.89648